MLPVNGRKISLTASFLVTSKLRHVNYLEAYMANIFIRSRLVKPDRCPLISCAYLRKNESKKISNCTLRHFFEIKPSDILYFRDFVRTTSDNWLSVKEYVHHDCIFSYGSENFSIRIHACTHPWSLPGAGGRKRTPVTFARSAYVALYFVHNK